MIRSSIMKQNKKAGFEMSITTIVVLVIAVIMLIMGLFLVRTIMCRGIGLATATLTGAEKEIQKLFTSHQEDITCLGTGATIPAIPPGSYGVIGCGLTPTRDPHIYDATFSIQSSDISGFRGMTQEATQEEFIKRNWISEGELTWDGINAGPGSPSYVSFVMRPPKDAPTGLITIQLDVTRRKDDKKYTKILRYEVKSLGMMRETIC